MNPIASLPEIAALDDRRNLVRIPCEQDVPVTGRIRNLIDTSPLRRLSRISQLGLVCLVYPGATHTRLEHSLGVYRNVLLFLRRLAALPDFCERMSAETAQTLVVAALLHDVGHWPYCHPLEDMQLPGVVPHERLAAHRICDTEIDSLLSRDFGIRGDDVIALLVESSDQPASRIAHSILSGPIDVDKMDYLYRDSLHAGVPYGMHYDRQRLIGSLCLDEAGTRLAITEKGCTAAELMVFARYVMFSEVYWHHTVRSATAMLQRTVFECQDRIDWDSWYSSDDREFSGLLAETADQPGLANMVDGLFGQRRVLYKRVAQFNVLEDPGLFARMAGRPHAWLVDLAKRLGEAVQKRTGIAMGPHDLLIDAPPRGLEIQFQIPVRCEHPLRYRWLGEVSPVVQALASRQFDQYVKRIRIFVHPDHAANLRREPELRGLLSDTLDQMN